MAAPHRTPGPLPRSPRWGWVGLGLLLLGVLVWIIFAFWGFSRGPQPPPVDFDSPPPGSPMGSFLDPPASPFG